MKKECPGRDPTYRQEWNIFLSERMFHNATMRHKELQRNPCGIPLELSETTLEHSSVWTLVGSEDSDLLQITEQIYKCGYIVVSSIFSPSQCDDLMKELWKELSECVTWAGLQGERGQPKHPLEPRHAPKDPKRKKTQPLRQGHRACSPGQRAEEPILEEEVGQSSGRALPFKPYPASIS